MWWTDPRHKHFVNSIDAPVTEATPNEQRFVCDPTELAMECWVDEKQERLWRGRDCGDTESLGEKQLAELTGYYINLLGILMEF